MSDLGDFLRELRGKRSLRAISEISGVSHNYLSIIEKGVDPRTKSPVSPSPETLKKLADAYQHPYEDLMIRAGYIKKDEDLEPHLALNNIFYPFVEKIEQGKIYPSEGEKRKVLTEMKEWSELLDLSDLQGNIDLSDEEIFKKYNFHYNGKPITKEAVEKILDFIRFMADRGF